VTASVLRNLLHETADVSSGRLSIGGCDVVDLANEFGTPLFIYDEQHLIDQCEEAVRVWGRGVAYASKAFLCRAMVKIAADAGMSIDVATGGELHVALAAGVNPALVVMHGNNKSSVELSMAIDAGVGRIVVDSFDELDRLDGLAPGSDRIVDVMVRINPGVEAHTHEYLSTGVTDSKFGFPIHGGIAGAAVDRVRAAAHLRLVGLHAHVGSQVFDVGSFVEALRAIAPFLQDTGADELSIGGGLGVAYVEGESAPSMAEWAAVVHQGAAETGLIARVTAEPGRSIVAPAAVTAYTVGTIKEVPGIRTYLAVDGGMSDNPRPVLYGSGYEAFPPRAVDAHRDGSYRIVGKHCESGDVIVRDANLPSTVRVGDIVCTPVTGAYGHSMGSNYNKVLRPPVVFALNGEARLVVERETYEDLLRHDVG